MKSQLKQHSMAGIHYPTELYQNHKKYNGKQCNNAPPRSKPNYIFKKKQSKASILDIFIFFRYICYPGYRIDLLSNFCFDLMYYKVFYIGFY